MSDLFPALKPFRDLLTATVCKKRLFSISGILNIFSYESALLPDGLPFGSYCSFDWDLCGWSAISQHSGWRRVAGNELLDKENMQGITLQRTPGGSVSARRLLHVNYS